jgi:hypothetical protein
MSHNSQSAGGASQRRARCDVGLAAGAPVGRPSLGYVLPAGCQSHERERPNSSSSRLLRRNGPPAPRPRGLCPLRRRVFLAPRASRARIQQAVRPGLSWRKNWLRWAGSTGARGGRAVTSRDDDSGRRSVSASAERGSERRRVAASGSDGDDGGAQGQRSSAGSLFQGCSAHFKSFHQSFQGLADGARRTEQRCPGSCSCSAPLVLARWRAGGAPKATRSAADLER